MAKDEYGQSITLLNKTYSVEEFTMMAKLIEENKRLDAIVKDCYRCIIGKLTNEEEHQLGKRLAEHWINGAKDNFIISSAKPPNNA